MNCPTCKIKMVAGDKVECKTGDARKHKCVNCGATHYEQLSFAGGMNMRSLKTMLAQVAAYSK